MDELQISGRRFISSRRVAKENGYHTDYIGQLIRGGKVRGQKVGRTWYVDAASFDEYLGAAPAPMMPPQKSSDLLSEPIAAGSAGQTFVQEFSAPAPVEEKVELAVDIEIKKDPEPVVETKVVKEVKPIVQAEVKKPVPHFSAGLKYESDDEPLLPEISPKEVAPRIVPITAVYKNEPAEENLEPVVIEHRPRRVGLLLGVGVLGVAVFVFSAVMSSTLFQTINVEKGNPASIGYSINW